MMFQMVGWMVAVMECLVVRCGLSKSWMIEMGVQSVDTEIIPSVFIFVDIYLRMDPFCPYTAVLP